MKTDYEIIIIGGGASGLAAAVTAAGYKKPGGVCVLDRTDRIGKKILATGGGRCNLSNKNISVKNYHGKDMSIAEIILKKFSADDAMNFFDRLGVLCKTEADGKIYPYCDQASSVLDAFRNKLSETRVDIKTNFDAVKIKKITGGFEIISSEGETAAAKKTIVACGGSAYPSLGSSGGGFKLLASLGHSVTKLSPALVPLKTENALTKALAGIKFDGELCVVKENNILYKKCGEILFTDYGLSGIPALETSGLLHFYEDLTARIDFMPEYSEGDIINLLRDKQKIFPQRPLEFLLSGMINKKTGMMLIKNTGYKLTAPISSLSYDDIVKLSRTVKKTELKITGTKGWDAAQVTAGGASLSEFNESLESKIIKNFYAAGEVLDVFGDCGGYNLHWAWASGIAAGKSAAGRI